MTSTRRREEGGVSNIPRAGRKVLIAFVKQIAMKEQGITSLHSDVVEGQRIHSGGDPPRLCLSLTLDTSVGHKPNLVTSPQHLQAAYVVDIVRHDFVTVARIANM